MYFFSKETKRQIFISSRLITDPSVASLSTHLHLAQWYVSLFWSVVKWRYINSVSRVCLAPQWRSWLSSTSCRWTWICTLCCLGRVSSMMPWPWFCPRKSSVFVTTHPNYESVSTPNHPDCVQSSYVTDWEKRWMCKTWPTHSPVTF